MSNQLVQQVASHFQIVPRRVAWAVDLQQYRGVEASARVRAASYVAHVGLTLTAQLTAEEGTLIQAYPLAEARLKTIVDQFALVASAEVAGMAF